MIDTNEITLLREEVEHLTAETAALREGSFRGSKAEALMALEYDRIPTVMKTQRAVLWQRMIATAVMFVVPLILITIVLVGVFFAFQDHKQREEIAERLDRVHASFQADPAFHPQK
jgi:hypothetical protein